MLRSYTFSQLYDEVENLRRETLELTAENLAWRAECTRLRRALSIEHDIKEPQHVRDSHIL